jgi:hypothetical protein
MMESLGQSISSVLKLLFWIALGLAGLALLIRYREAVIAAVRGFLQDLAALWRRLFGGGPTPGTEGEPQIGTEPRPRRFVEYPNPFAMGAAGRWPAAQLIGHTFEALEAWARERGCERLPDQTPHEFALAVGAAFPELSKHVQSLADLHAQAAYSRGELAQAGLGRLELLWRELSAAEAHRRIPATT